MMDPLGHLPRVVGHSDIPTWNQTAPPEYDVLSEEPLMRKKSPFAWDDQLNAKVCLWAGSLEELDTEAIVNSTSESLNDNNPLSERILSCGGHELRKELRNDVRTCRTGEAKVTKGYLLPARYIIHTVGPRYNLKYKTAAESALFNCYRGVMQVAREKSMSSIAICSIHSTRKGYPVKDGAHIALRTVRRFLEKYDWGIARVVFVVVDMEEEVYKSLLPLYFPRSASEEDYSAYHLPQDVGNSETGEPSIPERSIRIIGKLTLEATRQTPLGHLDFEESSDVTESLTANLAVGAHAFSKMEEDVDHKKEIRNQGNTRIQLLHTDQHKRYSWWLRRARHEDLRDVSALRFVYQSGFDKYGRPVVVFIGRHFPAHKVDLDKAVLYFLSVMDSVVNKPYVIVYLHTMTPGDYQPDSQFLKSVYNLVDPRYKDNLGAIYIVHSTLWSKVLTWFFSTFGMTELKAKLHHIPGLEYLYQRIPADQLDLPDFIQDYDIRINGTRYYDPDEDQAIGAL